MRAVLATVVLCGMTLAAGIPALAAKDGERIDALEARVKALEDSMAARVAELEKKVEMLSLQGVQREQAAEAMLGEINQLAGAGKMAEAKAKLEEFMGAFAGTAAANKMGRLKDELEVIGRDAPATVAVEKWYQGGPDLAPGKATLYVFWETWCPHCQREVPKLEALYNDLKGQGLQVVALTKLTRSSTDEKVQEFITQHQLTYPMAKETGAMSQLFNVSGIPAAAVVKDGKIVWRGHPGRLSAEMLKSYL